MPSRRDVLQPLTTSAFSNEVQEIMVRTPPWLLRWGITLVAIVLGTIIFLTWLINYPDMISAPISITGLNPAVEVVARQSGHLVNLRVQENQAVAKGEILGIIESPGDFTRVFAVKEELQKLLPFLGDSKAFTRIELRMEAQLGGVQTSYSQFLSEYQNYASLIEDDYTVKATELLQRQLDRKEAQVVNMRTQINAITRELELAQLKYDRMKALNDRDSLSTSQLQDQESQLLTSKRQSTTILNSLNDEEIAVADLEKQIRDLQHQRSEELRQSQARLHESLKKVLSDIEIWESDYVLRAPIDGVVAFYNFWSDQQYVTAGTQVFVIAPESTQLLGHIQIKRQGAGKIQPGNVVRIKCDDFPYKEFGMVTGTVKSVSLVAREGAHMVMVDLAYPLTTNFNRQLPFKQEMTGEASVVTKQRRLIERIFSELFRAIQQSSE